MISKVKHPGSDYVYVICDVCGRKVRRKYTQLVRDKWNFQNRLVVCRWDLDKINPQVIPYKHKERLVTSPETLRSEPSDRYITPDTDNRVPGVPQKLEARASTLGSTVELFWRGPVDVGTSQITGYLIERQEPQGAVWTVLISDSGSGNTYYNDTSASVSAEYTYRVAAINGAGTGSYSNEADYPRKIAEDNYIYLGINGGATSLRTSQGDDILVSPDV
jgi:hypothetical protein